MRITLIGLFCLVIGSFACQSELPTAAIRTIQSPAGPNSMAPFMTQDANGRSYLSWMETPNDTLAELWFTQWEQDHWAPAQQIAKGNNWFVNWADIPSLAISNYGELVAYFLEKNGPDPYSYEIKVMQSQDRGKNWSAPVALHEDSTQTEHGFVSILPGKGGGFWFAWLDGRNTKAAESHNADAGPGGHADGNGGTMSLRAEAWDQQGQTIGEWELDGRVCDCCQTSAAMTASGPVVVYRDRSETDIRDIAITRLEAGKWTNPEVVHADNWEIKGCPVNGPRIAGNGDQLALVWFSAAQDSPRVQLVFSTDGGRTFGKPIRIDRGAPLGRVEVVWVNNSEVMVSWLEKEESDVFISAAKVGVNTGSREDYLISKTDESRSSGFHRMSRTRSGVLFAWTSVDSVKQVKTAWLPVAESIAVID